MGFVCMILVLISLTSIPRAWSGLTPAARQTGRTLPVSPQQTNLKYAQSPTNFIASKQYDQNRNTPPNLNRPSDVSTAKGVNTFSPALPYDKLPSKQNVPLRGGNRGSVTSPDIAYPSVSLYNTNHNPPTGVNKVTNPAYPEHRLYNQNQAQGKQDLGPHGRQPLQPPQQLSSTNNSPKYSSPQANLNFNLFNSQNVGANPPYFPTNQFGGNYKGRLFQPQRGLYSSGAGSWGQSEPVNNNKNYDVYSGHNPILSHGFSIPTTYNGDHASILPNEAFSSVTDPSMDKRSVIGSYVPANNYVNPSNFLIPTEDKYSMIDRIFGGFQRPFEQSKQLQDKPPTRDINKSPISPTVGQYYNSNVGSGTSATRQNPSTNRQSVNYGNLNTVDHPGRNKVVAHQVRNKGPSVNRSKSFAAPGYRRGFNDDGWGSTNTDYGNSPTSRQESPTPLFSDFSYNSPLRLDEFRSKNLLGDKNFGQTEYDKNRVTSETLLGNNNFNSREVFSPSYGTRQGSKDSIFGGNGFKQVGGARATTGNSFDNVYRTGRGFDTNDSGKTTAMNEGKSSKQDSSDNYSQNDAYNDAKAYSDGDGYDKSFRYSDGGSDSDYNAKDDHNSRGFKNSYQNRDDQNDMKSYNNADGYNRAFYNGKNHDVTDGYTDNVNYNNKNSATNRQPPNSDADYRRGVANVASALTSQKPVQLYNGLPRSATDNLPKQASYKPFDINGPVVT